MLLRPPLPDVGAADANVKMYHSVVKSLFHYGRRACIDAARADDIQEQGAGD